MTRSKLSVKAMLVVSGIGLAAATIAGSRPAAAQSDTDEYSCPAGYVYDPSYGCTLSGDAHAPMITAIMGIYLMGRMDPLTAGITNSATTSPMAWRAALRTTPLV